MNVVDSSAWLEYLSGSSRAQYFVEPIEATRRLIVPVIVIYELGRELLSRAEELAMQNRCDAIHLDTSDFQAPGFYEKSGFKVFGMLEDYPPGYRRFFMVKDLRLSEES